MVSHDAAEGQQPSDVVADHLERLRLNQTIWDAIQRASNIFITAHKRGIDFDRLAFLNRITSAMDAGQAVLRKGATQQIRAQIQAECAALTRLIAQLEDHMRATLIPGGQS